MTRRAVFDCMVFLQAAANGAGPAGAAFERVENREAELVVSDGVMTEVRDAIYRPSIRKYFRTLTDERAAEFLAYVETIAVRVADVPAVVTLSRDPDDAMYLDLAVAAGADVVVSRDKVLLGLMTGTDPDAVAFRTNYPTIRVLDPSAFLRVIDANPPSPNPDPLL